MTEPAAIASPMLAWVSVATDIAMVGRVIGTNTRPATARTARTRPMADRTLIPKAYHVCARPSTGRNSLTRRGLPKLAPSAVALRGLHGTRHCQVSRHWLAGVCRLGPAEIGACAFHTPKYEFWKSVFVSSTHCASGCVIGDIIGAPIVFAAGWTLFGERLFADYVVLFALAFIFGIAFQYLAIREVRRITPRMALVDALKADTLALTAFEVGLFAWMAVMYFLFVPRRNRPPLTIGS